MTTYDRYIKSSSATLARRVQEQPHDPDLRFFLGLKLVDEHKLDRAVEAFESALELRPQFADAAYYLARAYLDLGMDVKAESVLLLPLEWGMHLGERFLFLAEICRRDGRLPIARDYYFHALKSSGRLGPRPHLGLTALLEAGLGCGLQRPQCAAFDQRIALRRGNSVVYARVRVFHDLLVPGGYVVILTSEADEFERGCHGLGVSNGAEILVEHLLTERPCCLVPERTTWVVMHEATTLGVPPMHIAKLDFRLAERPQPMRTWFEELVNLLAAPFRSSTEQSAPLPQVVDLTFKKLSHAELERSIGHRFFWA